MECFFWATFLKYKLDKKDSARSAQDGGMVDEYAKSHCRNFDTD